MQGAGLAVAAYFAWGIVPLYWRRISAIPAIELLAYRVLGSVVVLALLLSIVRGWPAVRRALATPATLRVLVLTTALISANWGIFIWAVQAHRLLEASFGYYVNPLANVALGVFMLGERLRRGQLVAVALATLGVTALAVGQGALPWVSLVLAGTFASYGLLRKTAAVDALAGLFVETLLITPLAIAYVAWLSTHGHLALAAAPTSDRTWVALCGAITALPLVWFTGAARRLKLSTLGFFQYIAPTCQFALAVAFGEPLSRPHVVAFAFIWGAVFVYSAESLHASRATAAFVTR
jgi:chloramphenicol-sensitive protein RarD